MKTLSETLGKPFMAVLVVVVALVGCTSEDGDAGKSDRAADASQAEVSDSAPVSGPIPVDAEPGREAFVYTAVIEELVSPGQADPPIKVVFVLDGVVPHAAKPTVHEDPEQPFSHALKDGLRFLATLRELPPLEFVPTRDSAVVGTDSGKEPGHARDGGAVISLGPIKGNGSRVEVATSLWVNGLWGAWQTYVVAESDGTWVVTGTTGPVAIS